MKDFGRSDDPRVQAQLDRLSNLTLREGRINLDTVRELFDRLGNPQDRLPPVFHVAGTNGKGSTCAFLRAMLEAEGYRIQTYTDGASALTGLQDTPPDIAIFDIKMPRMDGMDLLQRVRLKSAMPVIFLTSKDDEIDEVLGLRMGADDYVKKPFSQRLLVERIRALLRRQEAIDSGEKGDTEASKMMVRGELTMDPLRHAVTWKGQDVSLTVTEFLLLQALAQRPGFVKSRDQLMDVAYDDQVYVDDRTIDSHIKRLRKKLRMVDSEFSAIETLYGIGYRYNED